MARDFENNDERIARKKRGKGVEWETKFEFEFELDIKIQKEYIIQKKSTTKAGQITVYWCKYGKVVRKDKKVLIMDEKNFKGHDHAEVEGERIYHHYSDD